MNTKVRGPKAKFQKECTDSIIKITNGSPILVKQYAIYVQKCLMNDDYPSTFEGWFRSDLPKD
jgi:hypothetical protein